MKANHAKGCLWLRRLAAAAVLLSMTGLFLWPAVFSFKFFGWLPRIQLVPAVAAGSAAILAVIAVSVVLCGRLYCSAVCPLGILQDLFRAAVTLSPLRKPAKRSLPRELKVPTAALWSIRLALLAIFLASLFFGLFALLAPYGIFGRAASAFADSDVTPVKVVALAQLAAILLATLWRGRFWCNTVCPVGTFLGLFSRFAVFRVRIDKEKCVNCNLCVRACANGCISADKEKRVDHSRCVTCMACAGVCGKGALTWR